MDCCSWEHPEVRQPESIYLSILEVNHLDFRPGCLESFSPDGLVCEVEGELEDVCLGEDLFVGVQSVTAQLDGSLCCGPPWPNPQGSSRAASLCKQSGHEDSPWLLVIGPYVLAKVEVHFCLSRCHIIPAGFPSTSNTSK